MSLFGDICCLFSCSPRHGGNIPPENAGVRLLPVVFFSSWCYIATSVITVHPLSYLWIDQNTIP